MRFSMRCGATAMGPTRRLRAAAVGSVEIYTITMQGDLGHTEEVRGSVGVGFLVGNHTTTAPPTAGVPDIETTSININTVWMYQGVHALGEVFLRTDDQGSGDACITASTQVALEL